MIYFPMNWLKILDDTRFLITTLVTNLTCTIIKIKGMYSIIWDTIWTSYKYICFLHSFYQGSQFIPVKWTRFLEVLLIPPLCTVASNYITAILPWSQPRYKRLDNKNRLPCFPALLKFIYDKYNKSSTCGFVG